MRVDSAASDFGFKAKPKSPVGRQEQGGLAVDVDEAGDHAPLLSKTRSGWKVRQAPSAPQMIGISLGNEHRAPLSTAGERP